nr:hypothetical protein Iba_chr08fCG2540 [Ipomoea batatas]
MDLFTRYTYEQVYNIMNGDTIKYYVHTVHDRRYCMFEISRQRSYKNYVFAIVEMWTVLMNVIGFNITFPSNIDTHAGAKQFLNAFLQGSIFIDLSSITNQLCFGPHPHPSSKTITWFFVLVVTDLELQFPRCMYIHLLQHVNRSAYLFHGHAHPWELRVYSLDVYVGLELWLNSLGIQKDDLIIFRHVGCFNFHVFVIQNKHQVALPEVHGNALDREPIDDEDVIFVPAMSSINPDVGLATLSGCRTLVIDFEEFCNDQSTLTNFIYWTDSHGDSVDIIHGQFTITFTCAGPDSINYAEQYGFLHRILWNPNNVPGKLVFFNCEIGEVHVIVFDRCGLEILANHLHGYTITDYANVETFL